MPTATEFVSGLVDEMDALFAQLGERETLEAEAEGRVEVATLLRLALRSEMEACELAALWLPATPELDARALLARQCGDEMKHFQLITERLAELGETTDDDILSGERSAHYQYLLGLKTTIERVAAGPFAREAVARIRNAQFAVFCRAVGDVDTAALYDEVIQPDEVAHHELGRRVLESLCVSAEDQTRVREVTFASLAIADELSTLAARTRGFTAPVPVS